VSDGGKGHRNVKHTVFEFVGDIFDEFMFERCQRPCLLSERELKIFRRRAMKRPVTLRTIG
jgi:hypothetical protein